MSEQFSARKLLDFLRPKDLLLCDRNLPDKATFAAIRVRAADFLFHLPSNRFLKLPRTPVPSGRRDEWYVRIPLSAALRQEFPTLGRQLQVRIPQYRIPGFRPSWLITSLLDPAEFPYDDLVALYHDRWRQETFHREWKHTLGLSDLRSHTAGGLLKEVPVQLTLNNVIRWLMAQAAPSLCPVHLKFLDAKRLVLASLPAMAAAPTTLLPVLHQELLAEISRRRIKARPGRSYPRTWDARGRPKGYGKTTVPAKLAAPTENLNAPI